MPPVAQRRTCFLCGRAFAIIIPRDKPENDHAKLCGDCASLPEPPEEPTIGSLPEPPEEPTIGGDDDEPDDSSDSEDCSGV
jgi:hypothetical protein